MPGKGKEQPGIIFLLASFTGLLSILMLCNLEKSVFSRGLTAKSSCPEQLSSPGMLENLSMAIKRKYDPDQALSRARDEWKKKFKAIFRNRCNVCHGPGGLREDLPTQTFANIIDNPASIVQSLQGEHGQYAQSDRKTIIRWLENSLLPALEKSSTAAGRPPSSMAVEYEMADVHEDWQDRKPKAYPHPQNWKKTHRFRARVDRKSCFLCHQSQSYCVDCHIKQKPNDHMTRQWTSRIHHMKARIQPFRCASCHRANYCSHCHLRPF
ncbi:c-type cytochrome [Candidatus Riflebacteria bacterium]